MLRSSGTPNKKASSNMRDHGHNVGETAMPKFRIVKVYSFRIGSKRYSKGEVVELSEESAEGFKGADFLEPVEKQQSKPEKRVKAEQTNFPFFFLTVGSPGMFSANSLIVKVLKVLYLVPFISFGDS